MIDALKSILDQAEMLTDEQQKELAQLISDELAWDNTLAGSQDALEKLADEALQENRSGKTIDSKW